jgi:DNA-binding NarL/FixJ family response regulator
VAKIRVLLADDHAAILAQVRQELSEELEIVGAVANGRDAVEAVLRLSPDVLVTDISMPILNRFQVASQLRASNSRTRIVFLTIQMDQDYVAAALSAGAYGYVTKPHLSTDLIRAIREALAGQVFVSKSAVWSAIRVRSGGCLEALSPSFDEMCSALGRPSIAPDLLR